jgi:hypothetical protein
VAEPVLGARAIEFFLISGAPGAEIVELNGSSRGFSASAIAARTILYVVVFQPAGV